MLQDAEVSTIQFSDGQIDPTSDDIGVPELMQMVGEQSVDIRVKRRAINVLKARLTATSNELLAERSKAAQLKAGLEDALKAIDSLKKRIEQLEGNVYDMALARDDLKKRNEALEGKIKNVRSFSDTEESEECRTPSSSDED
jgi:chromosome segregation ATPase